MESEIKVLAILVGGYVLVLVVGILIDSLCVYSELKDVWKKEKDNKNNNKQCK